MTQYRRVGEVARLTGLSERALRFYEDEGLLSPVRSEAGYRRYSESDVRRVAHILAMRGCGLSVAAIRKLLGDADADVHAVLADHLRNLCAQESSIKAAAERTRAALAAIERIEDMEIKDAFEAMKEQGLKDFEETYGVEARQLYGDEAIDDANRRMMALTKDEWDAKELLEDAIKVQLRLAMTTQDAASEASRELARMHERWIAIHWGPGYEEEAYLSLVRGYLGDPRFVEYYDSAAGEGATEFLVQAVEGAHTL